MTSTGCCGTGCYKEYYLDAVMDAIIDAEGDIVDDIVDDIVKGALTAKGSERLAPAALQASMASSGALLLPAITTCPGALKLRLVQNLTTKNPMIEIAI